MLRHPDRLDAIISLGEPLEMSMIYFESVPIRRTGSPAHSVWVIKDVFVKVLHH
jgi:hypothetical protein